MFTQEEVEDILDGRLHSFIQDVAHNGTPQVLEDDTEARIVIDGDVANRNFVISPDYMTDRWDGVNNKMTFITEHNTPTYVADINVTFTPVGPSAGMATIRLWIDDPTTPKVIRTITRKYKGTPESFNALLTWYLGSSDGYDAKNDGIYFTIETEHAGTLTEAGVVIYRT